MLMYTADMEQAAVVAKKVPEKLSFVALQAMCEEVSDASEKMSTLMAEIRRAYELEKGEPPAKRVKTETVPLNRVKDDTD